MSKPNESSPHVAITISHPTPTPGELRLTRCSWDCHQPKVTSVPYLLTSEMLRCLITAQHTKTRRYVSDSSDFPIKLQARRTDKILKGSELVQQHHNTHHAILDNPANSSTFPATEGQLPQSPHHHPGTNIYTLEVENCCDKASLPDSSDSQIDRNFTQTIQQRQRDHPGLQVVTLQLDPPVLNVVETHPLVVVDSPRPLELYQINLSRLLKVATAIQIDDMDFRDSPSTPGFEDKDIGIVYSLDIATAEVIKEFASYDRHLDADNINHLLMSNDCMLLAHATLADSSTSLISNLPPLRDIDENFSPLHSPHETCRSPSLLDLYLGEDRSPVIQAPSNSNTILVNGKHHPHPLRSHPVAPTDYTLPQQQSEARFPAREDSLPLSETSSKGSISDPQPKRKASRTFFPPRKESLFSSNVFSSATKATRPSTAHAGSYSSISRFNELAPDVPELPLLSPTTPTTPRTPDTPTQRAVKALHRRSASVANLLQSLTSQATPRAQPTLTTQISPPVLIQAPVRSQSTVSIPTHVQLSAHAQTPYSMQRQCQSQIWNPSQRVENPNLLKTSTSRPTLERARTASQTSLHSNYQNRKAFVMQGPNSSVFSLHSQASTPDPDTMLPGYDTHTIGNINANTRQSPAPSPSPVPSSLGTPDSDTGPPETPISLKERRFRRILNLRKANAVSHVKNPRTTLILIPTNRLSPLVQHTARRDKARYLPRSVKGSTITGLVFIVHWHLHRCRSMLLLRRIRLRDRLVFRLVWQGRGGDKCDYHLRSNEYLRFSTEYISSGHGTTF